MGSKVAKTRLAFLCGFRYLYAWFFLFLGENSELGKPGTGCFSDYYIYNCRVRTTGDSNCLFRALAHQLDRPFSDATQIRQELVQHLKENSTSFPDLVILVILLILWHFYQNCIFNYFCVLFDDVFSPPMLCMQCMKHKVGYCHDPVCLSIRPSVCLSVFRVCGLWPNVAR